MNSLIERIYQSGYIENAQGERIHLFPTSIPYAQGDAMYKTIRAIKPENTLEIGMAYGLSTLFICQALYDNGSGRHTAIDPFERKRWQSIGLLNIQQAGLGHLLRFIEAPSHEALPELLNSHERFDFIFIDGCHRFDYTILEFFFADKLLPVGGCIMFDDLTLPAIRKALGFILRNRNYMLADEYISERHPLWKMSLRLIKQAIQSPLDILPSLLCFAQQRYCVVRKIADDDKAWDFYRSF